ncbi:MAG: DNA-formamidopyrimidine glycosylase family protein [Thermotogota bacterium]|nr:DNA-formamidopyrimidine glycosylase family protein [Thermotogota bacterium]
MPELPDVELIKRRCEEKIINKKIVSVYRRDTKVVKPDEKVLSKSLVGHSFRKILRHGKYMFVRLGKETNLLMHFGITGDVVFYSSNSEEPKHTSLRIDFEDDSSFSYICVRRLGKVKLLSDINDYISEQSLGKDALEYNKKEFTDFLKNKRGSIKSALMDQNNIAGIGNIYSDEIMYQAGIYPGKRISDLNEKNIIKIYSAMKTVLQTAIDSGAEPDKMPDNYLIRRRKEGEHCGICDGKIAKKKISGRTSYFCTDHQK